MYIYEPICTEKPNNELGGSEERFTGSYGKLAYTVKGSGPPLLLIHSISLGASPFCWRKNIDALASRYTVYALELPGFGSSEKRPMIYTANIFIPAITEFIEKVVQARVSIITRDLPAAYCSYIAYIRPELVAKLLLITPSGLAGNDTSPCESSSTTFTIFTQPFVGNGLYNTFSSKESLDQQLKTIFYSDPAYVTPDVIENFYANAHQCPNANYAPASFVAGYCNFSVRSFFGMITQPILILWGAKAIVSPVQNLSQFLGLRPQTQYQIFTNCGLILQEEDPKRFNDTALQFLQA
ncbi:alpha/beta fold hydrolase [Ectobacillus sp. JY-23]|uniref:alpha/beta fold hydrolase n=1 Tax=Ectobacillus sp. JY-23 TaxID=2933872 RepID=UPI001FF6C94A|nr:alpha/beta fold hydrolase [Ectobacillus sp. JY-23]UOY92534.1 alpha/beta fold hydrolase [Ectobacillus sp. JY-23]